MQRIADFSGNYLGVLPPDFIGIFLTRLLFFVNMSGMAFEPIESPAPDNEIDVETVEAASAHEDADVVVPDPAGHAVQNSPNVDKSQETHIAGGLREICQQIGLNAPIDFFRKTAKQIIDGAKAI